jgi:hypothetical protein
VRVRVRVRAVNKFRLTVVMDVPAPARSHNSPP